MATTRKTSVRAWLADAALPLWATSGFDTGRDLFHERLRPDGAPDENAPRRIRVQARQIYVCSHAACLGLFPAGGDLAMRAFATLLKTARQPSGGGFVHLLAPDLRIADPKLDTYDHAFLMLAFSWLYRATGDGAALRALTGVREVLDTALRHPSGRGYKEDGGGTLPRWQNPHMHLLEAFLAAYGATRDPVYLERASHIVGLFEHSFFQHRLGAMTEFFEDDLSPAFGDAGRIVDPGHLFEWIWLLDQHASAGGGDFRTEADALYGFGRRFGRDPASGLIFDEIWSDGTPKKQTKRCWPQTELLKAELSMAARTLDRTHADEADAAVDRLFAYYLAHPVAGGWHDVMDAHNAPVPGQVPASTLYHLFVALTEYLFTRDETGLA